MNQTFTDQASSLAVANTSSKPSSKDVKITFNIGQSVLNKRTGYIDFKSNKPVKPTVKFSEHSLNQRRSRNQSNRFFNMTGEPR